MGTSYKYKCNKCDYSVQTSGGFDVGMLAVTETYICTACKKLVDVCVGIYGQKSSINEIPEKHMDKEFNLNFYACPECKKSSHLILWDTKKKPCPKCNGKLEKDNSGEVIMWD